MFKKTGKTTTMGVLDTEKQEKDANKDKVEDQKPQEDTASK